jgi:hypothetical protein
MSNNKTISINPKLFNMSKNKTQKNKPKNKEKVNIVPPNLFKNKILKRIQKHKQREIKDIKKNKTVSDQTNDDNEFTSSLNYLNDVVKKQKQKKIKTFKNYSEPEKTNFNVNIDLPEELEEIKPNIVVPNDVPYGVLKKGNKPTYREYYNKTLKNKSFYNNPITTEHIIQPEKPETMIHRKPIIQEKSMIPHDSITQEDDLVFDDFDEEIPITIEAPIPPEPKHIDNINDKNKNKNRIKYPKKINKITKTTITKKYTLGKNRNKRKIGVLIKNNKTQKKIINAYKDLKKTPIKDIKDFLHKHNLIKIGSNIPLDVGRQMYEAAKLTGNVVNINSNNILHNLENAN